MILANVGRVVQDRFIPRGGSVMRVVGSQNDDGAPPDEFYNQDPLPFNPAAQETPFRGNIATERRNVQQAPLETNDTSTQADLPNGTGAGTVHSGTNPMSPTAGEETGVQTETDPLLEKVKILKEELKASIAETERLSKRTTPNTELDARVKFLQENEQRLKDRIQQLQFDLENTTRKLQEANTKNSKSMSGNQKAVFEKMREQVRAANKQAVDFGVTITNLQREITQLQMRLGEKPETAETGTSPIGEYGSNPQSAGGPSGYSQGSSSTPESRLFETAQAFHNGILQLPYQSEVVKSKLSELLQDIVEAAVKLMSHEKATRKLQDLMNKLNSGEVQVHEMYSKLEKIYLSL